MTDSFIPAGTTGKKLQTYENTVGSNVVHSEAVTLTDQTGSPQGTIANPVVVGGTDSGTLRAFRATPDGDQIVQMHAASLAFPDNASNTQQAPVDETDTNFIVFPIYPYWFDGSTWDRARGDATDGLLVNLGTNNDATPSASASVGTGTSHFRDPAVTNTAVAIKASAGKLHGYNLYNPNSSLAYVHFYNVAAASVVVGTTTPIRSVALPSTANGTVAVDREFTLGIAFGTAMSVAASTTATGGGAPSTALVVNAEYI